MKDKIIQGDLKKHLQIQLLLLEMPGGKVIVQHLD